MSESRIVPRALQQYERRLETMARDLRKLYQALITPAWIAVQGGVGFANSWVNYGAGEQDMQYRKVLDEVQLRGVVKSGTVGSVPIFTLPVGYRPPADVGKAVGSNSAFGYLIVQASTGDVELRVGSNVFAAIFITFSVTP